jgi:hypothetical protein
MSQSESSARHAKRRAGWDDFEQEPAQICTLTMADQKIMDSPNYSTERLKWRSGSRVRLSQLWQLRPSR